MKYYLIVFNPMIHKTFSIKCIEKIWWNWKLIVPPCISTGIALATAKRQVSPMKLFMIFANGLLFLRWDWNEMWCLREKQDEFYTYRGPTSKEENSREHRWMLASRPSQLGIGKDGGTRKGVGGTVTPPYIGRSVNPFSTRGAGYTSTCLLALQDFQTFRHPWFI